MEAIPVIGFAVLSIIIVKQFIVSIGFFLVEDVCIFVDKALEKVVLLRLLGENVLAEVQQLAQHFDLDVLTEMRHVLLIERLPVQMVSIFEHLL